jgi:hypothetical protein
MLTHNEVIDAVIAAETLQIGENGGVVFGLKARIEGNVVLIFLSQAADLTEIALGLGGEHTASRNVTVPKKLGSVVGKAEDLDAALNGVLNVFPHLAHGVVAKRGMGMIIGNHGKRPFFGPRDL